MLCITAANSVATITILINSLRDIEHTKVKYFHKLFKPLKVAHKQV